MSLISRLGALVTALLLFVTPASPQQRSGRMQVGLRIIGSAPDTNQVSPPRTPRSPARTQTTSSSLDMMSVQITFGGMTSSAALRTERTSRRVIPLRAASLSIFELGQG
jgi:hypothetical protein